MPVTQVTVGDLRHKITFQYDAQPDRVNGNGVPWPDWQPLVTLMAKKEGIRGYLFYQAAVTETESDITYTIRYREDIKATMQIIDGTNTYTVKVPPIDTDGRRKWLEIHARAVLQSGG
jgi:SPP1 family predicted phage head-tail adaptor